MKFYQLVTMIGLLALLALGSSTQAGSISKSPPWARRLQG
jgi:hypothetical protein